MENINFELPLRWVLLSATAMRQIFMLLAGVAVVLFLAVMVGWDQKGEMLPGAVAAVTCLMIIAGYFGVIRSKERDWEWLFMLTLSAFLIRAILSLSIYYFTPDRNFLAEDQPGYDILPAYLLKYWLGQGPRPEYLFSGFRGITRIGFFGLVAIQYLIFDVSYIVPRMFNCLAGAFLALYAYRIGSRAYGNNAGKVAGLMAAFFPSLVLWSSLNMRDIWLALAIIIIAWHAVLLREKISIPSIIVIAITLIWIEMNRAYLVPIMALTVASPFVFGRAKEWYKDLAILVLMLIAIGAVLYFFQAGKGGMEYLNLEEANKQRLTLARASVGKSGYLQDVDTSKPLTLLAYSPLLIAYFLFSPFPWDIRGVRQLLTLPEMIAWYICIPFVVMTMIDAIRDKTRKGLTLLMPLVIISVSYALSSGNMGLAYRHRAQVVTFYLIFAAAGFSKWRVGRMVKNNPQLLNLLRQMSINQPQAVPKRPA